MSLTELAQLVAPEQFVDDESTLLLYPVATERGVTHPSAVLFPRNTEQVASIVNEAAKDPDLVIAPSGAGTEGVRVDTSGRQLVLLDLRAMNAIEKVWHAEASVLLQAGVTYLGLEHALQSVGGTLSLGFTNGPPSATVVAGCLAGAVTSWGHRLGALDEALRGVEVVFGDGTVGWVGEMLDEDAAPPGPTGLTPQNFVGPNAMPGIVTRAVVGLARTYPFTTRRFVLCDDPRQALALALEAAQNSTVDRVLVLSRASLRMLLGGSPDSQVAADPKALVVLGASAETPVHRALHEQLIDEMVERNRAKYSASSCTAFGSELLARIHPPLAEFDSRPLELNRPRSPQVTSTKWAGFLGPSSKVYEAVTAASESLEASSLSAAWLLRSVSHGARFDLQLWLPVDDPSGKEATDFEQTCTQLAMQLGRKGFRPRHLVGIAEHPSIGHGDSSSWSDEARKALDPRGVLAPRLRLAPTALTGSMKRGEEEDVQAKAPSPEIDSPTP